MSIRPSTLFTRTLGTLALLVTFAASAHAQGQGHHYGRDHDHGYDHGTPPGHARHVVTVDHATQVTREVLVAHGYTVQRVEIVHGTRVVYYRHHDRRGRAYGPVERIVIRPNAERYTFDAAPKPVLVDINVKLGF